MPPLPPAPNVVSVAITGTTQGLPFANIFHLQYVGTRPSNSALDALCTSIGALWASTFAPNLPTTTIVNSIVATDLTDINGSRGISNQTVPGLLPSTGLLPVNVACCVTWKTQARWRGGHPRTYLPGMLQTDVANGNQWTQQFVTNITTAATQWHSGLNGLTSGGNSWTHVCLRRHQTLVDGTHVVLNPAVPVPIIGELVDHRVDSQRRRLGRDVAA